MVICLFIFLGITGGQDWLVGGYVSSIGPYGGDPSIAGLKRWLDYPIPTYTWIGAEGDYYVPYGVYSTYPAAYYPTPGWTPIYGVGWQVYNANWAKTLDYAQTKSSIRVYPRTGLTYTATQAPVSTQPVSTQITAPTTGDSTATIVSQGMRGYQVFLNGVYIGTEGTGSDPLDGRFTFKVAGNQMHEVMVYDGRFYYPKTMFFDAGGIKTIYVEPGTMAYI